MTSAKDMVLRPISSKEANELVKRVHYSGKVVNNSQLHIGAFLNGKLEGAMSFGPSLDKRKIMGLVEGTGWNEFIELNRMAFTDALPRNSESRAIAIAMKLLKKHAPHIKWVVTFADGAQCGDGTIYRASGFVLTGLNPNGQIWVAPNGYHFTRLTATNHNPGSGRDNVLAGVGISSTSKAASMTPFIEAGCKPIPGFQLRYIYFIDQSYRARLTVPELPFSEIERRGAGMYLGQPRAGSVDSDTSAFHVEEGGANPTPALQNDNPIVEAKPHGGD